MTQTLKIQKIFSDELSAAFQEFIKTWRTDKLSFFLGVVFLALFAGFFLLDKTPHRMIMYIGMPFMAYYAWKNLRLSDFDGNKMIWGSFAAVMVYALLSVLWSGQGFDLERGFQKTKIIPFVTIVILGLFAYLKNTPHFWKLLYTIFAISAFAAGLYILCGHYQSVLYLFGLSDISYPQAKASGVGRGGNPNMGAIIFVLAVLTTLFKPFSFFENPRMEQAAKIVLLCVFGLTLAIFFSRGGALALFGSLLAVFIVRKNFVRAFMLAAVGAALLLLVFLTSFDWGNLIERGSSSRIMIWQQAVEKIEQRPVFGHGLASKFYYDTALPDIKSPHPHNVYLGTLIKFGGIGFLFFTLFFGALAYKSAICGNVHENSVVIGWLCAGFVFGLVDMDSYMTNLSLEWLMSWLLIPLILRPKEKKHFL